MDLTEGSETSANINQTPGNHPKIEILKVCYALPFYWLRDSPTSLTQKFFALPTLHVFMYLCICVFCIYLRTNSEICAAQLRLIGFYNRDEKCLPLGLQIELSAFRL
jgi:hypothetical protein